MDLAIAVPIGGGERNEMALLRTVLPQVRGIPVIMGSRSIPVDAHEPVDDALPASPSQPADSGRLTLSDTVRGSFSTTKTRADTS